MGYISTWDIPYINTCKVTIAGEEVELPYTLCSSERSSYEPGMNCEVGWKDLQYLGEGTIATIGPKMKMHEVVARMKELGCIIPTVLLGKSS